MPNDLRVKINRRRRRCRKRRRRCFREDELSHAYYDSEEDYLSDTSNRLEESGLRDAANANAHGQQFINRPIKVENVEDVEMYSTSAAGGVGGYRGDVPNSAREQSGYRGHFANPAGGEPPNSQSGSQTAGEQRYLEDEYDRFEGEKIQIKQEYCGTSTNNGLDLPAVNPYSYGDKRREDEWGYPAARMDPARPSSNTSHPQPDQQPHQQQPQIVDYQHGHSVQSQTRTDEFDEERDEAHEEEDDEAHDEEDEEEHNEEHEQYNQDHDERPYLETVREARRSRDFSE
jgi:hypothetical protein